MKIKMHKEEESRANKLFLVLNYEGGDADTKHPSEVEIKNFKYDGETEVTLPLEVEKIVSNYKLLAKILDVNSSEHLVSYNEIEKKHGAEIARLFDVVPNDPQSDYQFKCYLDSITLLGYDSTGTVFESYSI